MILAIIILAVWVTSFAITEMLFALFEHFIKSAPKCGVRSLDCSPAKKS